MQMLVLQKKWLDLKKFLAIALFFLRTNLDELNAPHQLNLGAHNGVLKVISVPRLVKKVLVCHVPFQVSTMPDQALQAFLDHGEVARTIDANVAEAQSVYTDLEKLGIDWNEVGSKLEVEGVDSFMKSFDSLLLSLQDKANSLKLVSS